MIKSLAIFSSLAVSLATVLYLVSTVDLTSMPEAVCDMELWLLIAGFLVLLLNYLLRTWRFRLLIGEVDVPWLRLLGIVQLYGALNFLLPARTGELSFPLLFKRFAATDYSIGTGSLVAARILDLVALVTLLPLALAFSAADLSLPILAGSLVFVGAVFGILTLGLGLLYAYPFADTSASKAKLTAVSRFNQFLRRTAHHLSTSLRPAKLPRLILLSSGVWFCIALNFHLIAHASGFDSPFFAAFAITLLMIPLSMIPAQGFANLGTHEAAWISVLAGMGLGLDAASRIALLTHLVLFLYVVLLGLMGLALVNLKSAESRGPHRA